MDRPILQPGGIVLVEDTLRVARGAMINDGALARLVLGDGNQIDGLGCVPVPGALSVLVQPGCMTALDVVDRIDYGVLPADAHPLVKLFRLVDATTLAIAGPGMWTVQVAITENDSDPAVYQYYNPANPSQALSGPSGSGTAQLTRRPQRLALSVIAGTVAEPLHVALYTVIVPDGATAISGEMISRAPGAPFLDVKLPDRAPLDSPLFRSNPRGPTRPKGDKTISLATTEFVQNELVDYSAAIDRLRGGRLRSQVFREANLWTVPARVTGARVRCVGGGGGSCGSSVEIPGAGGGGGGYAEGWVPLTPGQVVAVNVGIQGLASGTNSQATPGGTSSFGAYLGATGGAGGNSQPDGSVSGGLGGYGYGPYAQVATTGGDGGDGHSNGFVFPGYGGSSALAGSARAGTGNGTGGGAFDGRWPGGGAAAVYGYVAVGANGALGCVIVEWWSAEDE